MAWINMTIIFPLIMKAGLQHGVLLEISFFQISKKDGVESSDCPSLAEKIKQKTNGYAVKQMSVDGKKYEVIKKIVDEYNSCR